MIRWHGIRSSCLHRAPGHHSSVLALTSLLTYFYADPPKQRTDCAFDNGALSNLVPNGLLMFLLAVLADRNATISRAVWAFALFAVLQHSSIRRSMEEVAVVCLVYFSVLSVPDDVVCVSLTDLNRFTKYFTFHPTTITEVKQVPPFT